jgi:hypothetical protein
MHQRAFLSVRKLLQEAGYDLIYYDVFWKPHLKRWKIYSMCIPNFRIIISDEAVGIDIELQRDKIIRIADKFCDQEFQFLIGQWWIH